MMKALKVFEPKMKLFLLLLVMWACNSLGAGNYEACNAICNPIMAAGMPYEIPGRASISARKLMFVPAICLTSIRIGSICDEYDRSTKPKPPPPPPPQPPPPPATTDNDDDGCCWCKNKPDQPCCGDKNLC